MSLAFLSGIYAKKTNGYQDGFDRGYQDGFDKGVEDGGEGKPETSGSFNVTENGDYTFTPNDGEVFSSVKVNVAVEEVLGDIECSYVHLGACASYGAIVGITLNEWIFEYSYYNVYGYALAKGLKGRCLKLTGATLTGTFTAGDATLNILFVTGYTSEGGGTCVVASEDIVVSPSTWDGSSTPYPTEFLITVPTDLDVDGMYISVLSTDSPKLSVYDERYENGYADGYADGFESGYADGYADGSESGSVEGTFDTTLSVATGGTEGTWYCPPNSEGGTTYGMMSLDTTWSFIAYSKWSPAVGSRYKIYCNPMGELWQTFVFGKSDYSSLAVVSDNASVGQYVDKINDTTFVVTIPPECANLFINCRVAGGCVAFLI